MITRKIFLAYLTIFALAFSSCEVHKFYGHIPKRETPYYGKLVGENDSMAVYFRNEAYTYIYKEGWRITKLSIWVLNKETNKCRNVITSTMRSGPISVDNDSILYKIPIND